MNPLKMMQGLSLDHHPTASEVAEAITTYSIPPDARVLIGPQQEAPGVFALAFDWDVPPLVAIVPDVSPHEANVAAASDGTTQPVEPAAQAPEPATPGDVGVPRPLVESTGAEEIARLEAERTVVASSLYPPEAL